ncbi:hypothetical protein [Nocardioides panaciterrulae]|uniref:Uncharacterized protein n=1 Tax=Nocardioides panaciterrulae TaxID=661492 RepID=A0A7Y9E7R3_9ACTN|nr:hypothetical protein [Nocardioides panaciterrulae]NYD42659.1 hypothetical protein [Nocardioides panaciterrulae]
MSGSDGLLGERERVAVPAVLGLQVQHRELAGPVVQGPAERAQHDLGQALAHRAELPDLVVAQAVAAPGEQLAVGVDGQPDPAHHQVGPAQQWAVRERGGVAEAVGEADR